MTKSRMPFKWKFAELVKSEKISLNALAKVTDVSITTLYSLKNHTPKRLDIPTMDNLFEGLEKHLGREVEVSEVFEYVR